MLLLSLDVQFPFAQTVLLRFLLVDLVLHKHLLKVVSLLISLLRLQLSFLFHFFLKAIYEFYLLLECMLLVVSPLAFLFHQLAVARIFFLLDFQLLHLCLLFFSHPEQLDVLLLKFMVNTIFFLYLLHALTFFYHLLVELLPDEAAALLLSEHALLLLLIMKQLVELLNCCPFVIFGDFAVYFGEGRHSAGSD